jgi:hypothetical protein
VSRLRGPNRLALQLKQYRNPRLCEVLVFCKTAVLRYTAGCRQNGTKGSAHRLTRHLRYTKNSHRTVIGVRGLTETER